MARILVLDDERDACDLIERVLGDTHDVVTFTEEDEAIDYFKNNPVDLVVLDIKLKKMSGVDVLGALKDIRSDVKAVMLTGYPTVRTAEHAITLGAYEYLTKPLDIDQLEAKINEVLSSGKKAVPERPAPQLDEDLSFSD